MLDDYGIKDADGVRKQLETQHWLELIDGSVLFSCTYMPLLPLICPVESTVMAQIVRDLALNLAKNVFLPSIITQ